MEEVLMREGEGIKVSESGNSVDVTVTRTDHTSLQFGVDFKESLSDIIDTGDYLAVIDCEVWKHHYQRLDKLKRIVISAGDGNKNQATIDTIIDAAIASGVSRAGYFVAIGGGTVTDMVGFAANNYFRGIKYVNVPTTLLGMVDAAVGGKTAINHVHQKNMIGSFYHPAKIIYDFSFLDTLPLRDYHNGFGEIIKVALLSKLPIFEQILQLQDTAARSTNEALKNIIKQVSVEKLSMLGANCFERDLKRPLNLGHTIAHPVEDITDFKIYHGEAVTLGCLFATYISTLRGKASRDFYSQLRAIVQKFHLLDQAVRVPIDKDLLWDRLQRLVKQRGGVGLLYVLPVELGSCEVVLNITREEFNAAYGEVIEGMSLRIENSQAHATEEILIKNQMAPSNVYYVSY